jgi:hypothetical protein
MKFAKTIVILFAFVMAFSCFHATALFAGDEHPWDEESDHGIGDPLGEEPNTDNTTSGDDNSGSTSGDGGADESSYLNLKTDIQMWVLMQSFQGIM